MRVLIALVAVTLAVASAQSNLRTPTRPIPYDPIRPNPTTGCKDTYSRCASLSKLCSRYPWMHTRCAKTCGCKTTGLTTKKAPVTPTTPCHGCLLKCSRVCNLAKSNSRYNTYCTRCKSSCTGICSSSTGLKCTQCIRQCKKGDQTCLSKCRMNYCKPSNPLSTRSPPQGINSQDCKQCKRMCQGSDCNTACARRCNSRPSKYWPSTNNVDWNDKCLICHQRCLDDPNKDDRECHSRCNMHLCGAKSSPRRLCHVNVSSTCNDVTQQKGSCMKAHITCEQKFEASKGHTANTSQRQCMHKQQQCIDKCRQPFKDFLAQKGKPTFPTKPTKKTTTPHMRVKRQLAVTHKKPSKGKHGHKKPSKGKGKPGYNNYYNHGIYGPTKSYSQLMAEQKTCINTCYSHNCMDTDTHSHAWACFDCHTKCKHTAKDIKSRMQCDEKCSMGKTCAIKDIEYPDIHGHQCSLDRCTCIQAALDKQCAISSAKTTSRYCLSNKMGKTSREHMYQIYCSKAHTLIQPRV